MEKLGLKTSISPNYDRKGVAFKQILFPLIGLSKNSQVLRDNEHGSMASMPHLQEMEWDFAERLSHITKGTTEAYYNYDGGGERVRKVVEKGGVVETRLYLGGFEIFRKKVGDSLELERETLHIMDDTRRIALVETLIVNNGMPINNPVSVQRYQLSNNIESATLELDENANIISYEEYYSYGDTSYQAGRSASEVSQKRYRYTGKEKDEESELYYHGARYYACWLGRWTAVDPAGLVDGVNLYMYCRGDPIIFNDPSGNRRRSTGYIITDTLENMYSSYRQDYENWRATGEWDMDDSGIRRYEANPEASIFRPLFVINVGGTAIHTFIGESELPKGHRHRTRTDAGAVRLAKLAKTYNREISDYMSEGMTFEDC
ncbi:MAG: RHS repeat-associated core domain-containing protein [Bacteroidales bacterium]|jgi:RHS repeat-associated protein|nr:RHS repeat-associated core domain-containing protein [Bacteroidales bacterium]